jgi:hypothetical protein
MVFRSREFKVSIDGSSQVKPNGSSSDKQSEEVKIVAQ